MLLVVAAPAMAQADKYQHTGTGVLGEPYTVGQNPEPFYPLTDEETGTVYELYSGFVHLAPYVGERVTFEGQQSQGLEPGPGDPVSVNVTSLEPVDGGPPAQEIAVITGALEPVEEQSAEGPTHTITEHGTDDVYGLFSDAQGVDLSQYEGQSVAIYGVFQTQGAPISDFEDPNDVLVYVTSVESLEPLPGEPPRDPGAKITGVISANPDALIPGGEPTSHLIKEDGTGDVYMISNYGQGPDLVSHEGQRVTIYGIFQTYGGSISEFDDPTKVAIAVTRLEVLEDAAPSEEPEAERALVTFELAVQNEVPEGRTLGLGYAPLSNMPEDFKGVAFCTTDSEDTEGLPACEANETYTGTLKVPVGFEFSYDFLYTANYNAVRCDYMGPTEVFYSDTQVFTEATTVSATYTEDGLPADCRAVGEAPAVEDQYQDSGDSAEEPASDDAATDAPVTDEVATDEVATDEVATDDAATDENSSEDSVLSFLPDTGGFSPAIVGLVALLLLSGGGLLAYGSTRR